MNVELADFKRQEHRQAIIDLMNAYMSDDMGGKLPPYNSKMEEQLLRGLEEHPSKLILLVRKEDQYIGLSNCFVNFGTFAAKPFINIHDVIVKKTFRGKGAGRVLMEGIAHEAKKLCCSKITLEVREDNIFAQKLYKKMGYGECNPRMYFWTKYL